MTAIIIPFIKHRSAPTAPRPLDAVAPASSSITPDVAPLPPSFWLDDAPMKFRPLPNQ